MKRAIQGIWLVCGALMIVVLLMTINIGMDVRATVQEWRTIGEQVTIQDMRQAMNIIEKQIDEDLFEQMTYRGYITDQLIGWTPENWKAFLDFCAKNGYIITDENWQQYTQGKLKP